MLVVRDESPRDWNAVYQAISSAFGQSGEAELVEELRATGSSVVSLVAEEDGQIVGHVLLSRMEAPFPAVALAPVSVIPTRQRSGIGSALIERAVDRARAGGWAAIFVVGDPNYYERFGFDRDAVAQFHVPVRGPAFHGSELAAIPSGKKRRATPRASVRRARLAERRLLMDGGVTAACRSRRRRRRARALTDRRGIWRHP